MEKRLRKKGYRIRGKKDGCTILTRGESGWWGAEIVHLGLLIVIVGGIISARFSENYYLQLIPGETGEFAGNKIRLLDFQIPTYPDGTPRQYISQIVLFGNQTTQTATLKVNHPVKFRGYWIYQSSYGISPYRIKNLEIVVESGNTKYPETTTAVITFGKFVTSTVLGHSLTFYCPLFIPDFVYDIDSHRIYSRSPDHNNPAVYCEIFTDGEKNSGWLFLKFPHFNSLNIKNMSFYLRAYTPIYYSGLEINRDPGTTLFIIGSLIMIAGLFLSFYIPFQRIWICRCDTGTCIGGISYRGQKRLIEDIKDAIGRSDNEMD